jgi:hypothetical protein
MQLLIPKQKIQDFVIKNWTWILSLAFLLMILTKVNSCNSEHERFQYNIQTNGQ